MERRNIEVPRAHGGEAVARIVHDGLGVAHATAKGLIDEGCVTLNGRPVTTHGQRVAAGDVVEVRFDPARHYHPIPTPRHGPGFRIVHEDYEIVVVNKMPGVLTSPSPRVGEESLAERIADSLRARGIKRPQIFVVHRLDRHTSGLLVFAKTQRALESLSAQFESREAGRIYSAIVEGRVEKDRGTIVSYLLEDSRTLSVRTTPLRGAGKRAVTHFQVVERLPATTIVRARLETGRKHQIRIHLAEIGHPVLGDRRYGSASPLIARVALHAERLTFKHPKTLEKVTYEAPWPDDLTRLAHLLRKTGGDHEALGHAALPRTGATGRTDPPRVAAFPNGLALLDPLAPVEEKRPSVEARTSAGTRTARSVPARARGGPGAGAPAMKFVSAPATSPPPSRPGIASSPTAKGVQRQSTGAPNGRARRLAFARAVGDKSAFRPRSQGQARTVGRSEGTPASTGEGRSRLEHETAPRESRTGGRPPAGASRSRHPGDPRFDKGGQQGGFSGQWPRRSAADGRKLPVGVNQDHAQPGSEPTVPRSPSTQPRGTDKRKPWEFKQKGSTRRRERRRKIAAAQAKSRKKKN